jgi:hypothetical protein
VRIEKIIDMVLDEAHKWQVE